MEPLASGPNVDKRAPADDASGDRGLDDTPMLLRWRFPPSSEAPGEARVQAGAVLDGSSQIDTALVLISELVTNAVLHTADDAELRIMRFDARIRVEVEDRTDASPTSPPTPGAHGGFGLRIVAAMADRWGTDPAPGGKVVWFELADG